MAQVSPAGKKLGIAFRNGGSTGNKQGLINWPVLLHSPPNSTDEFLDPNEIHKQYQDFVITPSARVIEVTSTFKDTSLNKGEKIVNWEGEVKSIYDVGDATCAQKFGSEDPDA